MKHPIKATVLLPGIAVLCLTISACGGGGGGGGGDDSGSSNDSYHDSWTSGSSDSSSSNSSGSSDSSNTSGSSSDMVTSKLFPQTDYFGAAFILRADNFKGTYTFVKTGINQANVTSQQPIEITLGSGNVIKGSFSGTVKQSNNTVGEFYLVFEGTLSGATHTENGTTKSVSGLALFMPVKVYHKDTSTQNKISGSAASGSLITVSQNGVFYKFTRLSGGSFSISYH